MHPAEIRSLKAHNGFEERQCTHSKGLHQTAPYRYQLGAGLLPCVLQVTLTCPCGAADLKRTAMCTLPTRLNLKRHTSPAHQAPAQYGTLLLPSATHVHASSHVTPVQCPPMRPDPHRCPRPSQVEGKIRQLIDQLHASAAVAPFAGSTARERDPVSLLPSAKGKVDKAVLEHVTAVAPVGGGGCCQGPTVREGSALTGKLCTNSGRAPASLPASQLIESGRPHSSGLPPRPPTSSSRPGTSSRPPTSLSASAVLFGATASSASRPGTAGGPAALTAAGASRPSTASSAASSAATRYTEAGAVVAAVGAQLSVASIDTVRELLRGALADERAALMEDIEYLQVRGWRWRGTPGWQ